MTVIQVKDWVPDGADLANPGSIEIVNAVPGLNSYKPFGQLVTITNALDARPRGAIEEKDSAGNVFQYVGNATKLYELVGTTWTDISISGGYSTGTDENWEFARWKEQIIATNFTDDPQEITLDGVIFANLTTDLRFRHVAVVRDFVVAGNTFDGVDGNVSHRLRWSAFNDATDWTVSPVTLADFRDLNKGGPILKIIGGDFGVIVSEKSTWRMTFIGSPAVFDIAEVIPGVGALASGAVTLLGDTVYMWSEHGFVSLQGGVNPQFIGAGRVDKFLRDDLDQNHLNRISSVADPESGRIFWAYPGAGNTDGRPNKIAVYDRILNKWGYIEQDVEILWRAGGVATTLEALDSISSSIDALGIPLDSSQWKGGSPVLAGFDSTFKNGNFTGGPMTAIVTTKEAEITAGRRTQLNSFRPLVDGGTVTAKIGTRDNQSDDVVFTSELTQTSSGRFTKRKNARYHRFQLICADGWKDAIGVAVERDDARPAGGR